MVMTARPLPELWVQPIAQWQAKLTADGFSPQTIRDRIRAVRRAAQAFAGNPWDLTANRLDRYAAVQDWSEQTRGTWTRTVRLFYEFALSRGWTTTVPTPDRHAALIHIPVVGQWEVEVGAWSSYLSASGHSHSSIRQRQYLIRRMACAMPDLGPWDVQLDDIVGWLGTLKCGPNTRRTLRNAICTFYKWGEKTRRVRVDPTLELPNVRPRRAIPRPAPEAAVAEAVARSSGRVQLMILLAAGLGLRRSEVASLHTDNLVLYPAGWTLRIVGKGDQVRELPLPEELGVRLSDLPSGWVFPSREEDVHLSPAYVGKLISAVLPDAWAAHSLRHRFASRAYAAERDIMAVKDLMGHVDVRTTQIYTQVPDGAKRTAVLAAAIVGGTA